jgi:DNA processing protein
LGIDSQCQRGALAVGGQTIGVLALGLDRVYPKQHQGLAVQLLAEGGALVSEFPLGTEPLAQNFPRRNRLISGLSLGVIVVEAALKSGSLITARYAAEQGREVFAIPGSIRQQQCQGCHTLIKEGAHLLDNIQDLADVWPELFNIAQLNLAFAHEVSVPKEALSPPEQRLLMVFDHSPLDTNEILSRMPLTIAELSVLLTSLMLKGYLIRETEGFSLAL